VDTDDFPAGWLGALRRFYHQQLRLQQMYINRHDVSGGDALAVLNGWTGEQRRLEDLFREPSIRRRDRRPGSPGRTTR
jgi:hypothetical protein